MFRNSELNVLAIALVVLTLEILVFAYIKAELVLPLLPIYIFLLVYTLFKIRGKRTNWQTLIDTKTTSRRTMWRQALNALPVGIVVIDHDGKTVWLNKTYSTNFQRGGKTLPFQELITPEGLKALLENQEIDPIIFDDKVYSVKVNFLGKNGQKHNKIQRAVCFEDITEFHDLRKQIDDNEAVICYIHVDSFDEIIVAYSEENRPELLARIDKTITQWVHNYNGFIKKYDNDKYISILSLKEFKRAEEDKFTLLDTVKEIKLGPAISVTLSIGASHGEDTLAKVNKTAQKALELCLGRGGDQIVVKTDGKTYFYGGKTKEIERYSRVRARVISQALKDLMDESDTVIIMGHMFPDMDALGSGIGVLSVAQNIGKPAYIVMDSNQTSSVESLLEFLLKDDDNFNQVFIEEKEALEKITRRTLLVVVDTHRPSFCMSQKVLDKAEKVVVIDHHRRGEEFIEKALLVYLEPYASSTSEMVSEILQYIGDDLEVLPKAATAMLAGIAVDTQNFAFKTGVRTFEAASFLRRLGADPIMVYKLLQEDMAMVNARNEVVKRAKEVLKNIVVSYYTEKPENPSLSAALAANSLLELKGVLASFVLVPTDEGISISGRSLGNINVQRVLEKLGGGGHMTVAGAQLTDINIEEALEKIKQAILEYIQEGEAK